MQSLYQKSIIWICLLAAGIGWQSPAAGNDNAALGTESKTTIKKAVLNKDLLIMPQLNKLNFGFGSHQGIEYFYEKSVSKIFFQDRKLHARVENVVIEGLEVTLALSHSIIGEGIIKFFFSNELLEQTTDSELAVILLETLADENHQYVFADPESKLYHLWSCNHSTGPNLTVRMRREDAEIKGYRASGFCFKKMLYLPQFSVEKALEKEWALRLRDYEPIDSRSDKQALLAEMGRNVLQHWPLKRIGYDYSFYLSDSRRISAFAIPTGKIIITTALFDSLANNDEIEALLVYAIAHIELRHSLKEYYACLQDGEYADAMKKLAAAAGSLVGPASGIISGALDAALPETSCNPQSLGGYQTVYTQEADSMASLYFEARGKDKRAIASLMKKLQFNELSEKLHPDQRFSAENEDLSENENYYDDRLNRVKNTQFVRFGGDRNFVFRQKGKPPVQLDLIAQRIYKKENALLAYIDESHLLQLNQDLHNDLITELLIEDRNGKHLFELDEQSLTHHVWGAFLIFEAASPQKRNILQDIEKVVLTLISARGPTVRESTEPGDKMIKGPGDVLNDPTLKRYVFVPGKIEW